MCDGFGGFCGTPSLCALSNAFYAHAQGVKSFGGGYKKGPLIFASETDVGRPAFRYGDYADLLPFPVEDRYPHFPCEVKIARAVDRHSVRSHFAEKTLVGECSIGLNAVAKDLSSPDIGYKEQLAVCGSYDSVRLYQIVYHSYQTLAIGAQVIDSFTVLLFRAALPIRPAVERIGEVKTSVGTYPNIVGPVQKLSLVVFHQNGDGFIRGDPPEFVVFVRAGDKVSFGIKVKPIGSTARLHIGAELTRRAPKHYPVVGLVREIDVSRVIRRRAFSKREAACKFNKLRSGGGEAAERLFRSCKQAGREKDDNRKPSPKTASHT